MGKLNMNKVQKQKQDLERQGSGNAFDKLAAGNNLRRILWPKGDSEDISSEGWMHFGLGEDGKTSMVCRKTESTSAYCPICEYIATLQKSKDKNDIKLAGTIKARKRVYYNVLNRDDADNPDTVKILAAGTTIQRQIVEILCEPDYGDITDYNEGRDINIKRSGQGLTTEYTVLPKPNKSVASDLSMEEIENAMTDLNALWNIPTVEEAKQVLIDSGYIAGDSNKVDELEYDNMDIEELTELCKKRGLTLPEKVSKYRLITLLTEDDVPFDSDEGENVKDAIASALNRRK